MLNSLAQQISKMGDRQDNKRPSPSSDSNSSGYICQKCELLVDKIIPCSGCKLTFCLRCGKITDTLYRCIIAGELENFHISATLDDIKGKYEYRMTNLAEKLGNLEQTTKQEVATQVSKMKDDIINSLKGDIHTVVDQRTQELEDRKRRELNISIFNLKEQHCNSGTDNKRADELDVRTISASLGLENLSISTTYRLGRKEEGKIRPLKVVLA